MAKVKKEVGPKVQEKFTQARAILRECLIERDEEIDVVMTALICGENPLLVGPPGTAKSFLLDGLLDWMDDCVNKFSYMIGKFTQPEEIFGPLSIQALKQDRIKRITTGRMPEAHGVFLDEIFKGSTAILNQTLRVLNEHKFENDGGLQDCPLLICVAASNEWPNDREELGALFDRFLFRKTVRYISSRQGRDKLLWTRNHKPEFENKIKLCEVEAASKMARYLEIPGDVKQAFTTIIDELAKEGIKPGDRRMYKAVDAVKAYGYLNGRQDVVEIEDLEILSHVLWVDPTEQPDKCAKVVGKIANPMGSIITDKLMMVDDILSKNSETEAVPKLQNVLKELRTLPRTGPHADRLSRALKHVSSAIESEYRKVVGVEEEEST